MKKYLFLSVIFLSLLLLSFIVLPVKAEDKTYLPGLLLNILDNKESLTVYSGTGSARINPYSYNSKITTLNSLVGIPVEYTYHYFVIKVGNIAYIGEYKPWLASMTPKFVIGEKVNVRFNENKSKMYIKIPESTYKKEVATKIVKQIRV